MRCDPNAWAKDFAAPGLEGRIEVHESQVGQAVTADPVDLSPSGAQIKIKDEISVPGSADPC